MKRTFAGLILGGVLVGTPALADRATILVLDASGSMWAQLPEGRSRIEVARDVLSDFLTTRDAALPLGVIAYGHNRKGDCADIEVVAPVGAQEGAALAQRLRGLMPQGKTPLADALRMAGGAIPRTAEEADIVLITDGLESCGGDPCAVAADLRAQGIPVRAHVVGFGLTEGAATLAAPDTAVARARIAVTWQGPDNQNDFVIVVEAGAPDSVQGNLARTHRGNPADLLLPDALGAHELRYVLAQSGGVLAVLPMQVGSGEVLHQIEIEVGG